eukprot:1024611-Lingulodinium_polyedra.AAC.1
MDAARWSQLERLLPPVGRRVLGPTAPGGARWRAGRNSCSARRATGPRPDRSGRCTAGATSSRRS